MKKNNKLNKVVILVIIALILVISFVVFILNYSKDETSLTILEKNWISNNSSNVIDVSVYNNVPVYGMSGEGIIFSYLDEFTKQHEISFNKISYLQDSDKNLSDVAFRIIDFGNEVSDNDILLYQDYYAILSLDHDSVNTLSDLANTSVGALDNDLGNVKYYLNEGENTKFISCTDFDECLKLLKGKEVNYVVVPQNMYADEILSNDLKVVYHLNDLYKNYVLTVKSNKTLYSIMNKFWLTYKKDYFDETKKTSFLNTFFKYKNISEAEKVSYNSNAYIVGYVVNMPFENMIDKEFVGTLSNYLNDFTNLLPVEFNYKSYNSIASLKEALSRGEIDLAFANFNTEGINVDIFRTDSLFAEEYVILSQNNIIVNSIRSLKNKNVYTVNNTYLYDYLTKNSVVPTGYNNTDDLLRNIRNDSIIILDRETYEYYQNKKFKNYKVVYSGMLDDNYSFVVRDVNKNTTFYQLFNYFVSTIDYKSIKYNYNTSYIVDSNYGANGMLKYVFMILGTSFLILLILFIILKIRNRKKELKKDDKLKYIDVMTSLKNRNYLNYNIKTWDENVIYPQAIVIIDLNNIKYINDNYGHTEGDEVIKKAAGILIVNQLENTDIVRTDGNEFLIYMVGYDEKSVIEYTRKLSKELKELPHEFGATFGYSMITDDIKTIDDAINEATLSMRQAKEKI